MTEASVDLSATPDSKRWLNPLVYWAQTKSQITLKVDLSNAKPPTVKATTKTLTFVAEGCGARGLHEYKFHLVFFNSISNCSHRLYDNCITVSIKKCESGWWPRLIGTPQKPHWLKIDFDRWSWNTEDDVLLEEESRDVMRDYAKEYEQLQKEELGYIKESTKKVYLIFYNLTQFVGYLYILCVTSILYYRDGAAAMPKTYEAVGNAMKFCQLLQYLEVLHPLFGYTKGGTLMPFFQINGRNFILFIMIEFEERMQTKPVIFYIFIIWSLIEVVRYPYYISQIVHKEIGLLTWLRYTLWIPLYPMGILCEGIIILRNIPYFEETSRFSVAMPNTWNNSFDMPTFLKLYLLLLILPGTYMVMTHMAKVRAKKMGSQHNVRVHKHLD